MHTEVSQTGNAKPKEALIDAFSTHWVKYVTPVFVWFSLTAIGILLFYFAGLSAHHIMWVSHATFLLAMMLMLCTHHWFFHRILSEGMVDVIITNRRLIFLKDNLWFCDDMHEIALERIRAVEARKRGLMENVLRYGSLWFDTGGSAIESGRIIPLVPHPHTKAKIIMELLGMK